MKFHKKLIVRKDILILEYKIQRLHERIKKRALSQRADYREL